MIHENFNFKEHGFVGHLAEPDGGSDRAVIVVMGGEQSLLPGIKLLILNISFPLSYSFIFLCNIVSCSQTLYHYIKNLLKNQ